MNTNQASTPKAARTDDEPDITQEESVPSDGKDTEGEKLMETLGDDKPGKPLAPTHPKD